MPMPEIPKYISWCKPHRDNGKICGWCGHYVFWDGFRFATVKKNTHCLRSPNEEKHAPVDPAQMNRTPPVL